MRAFCSVIVIVVDDEDGILISVVDVVVVDVSVLVYMYMGFLCCFLLSRSLFLVYFQLFFRFNNFHFLAFIALMKNQCSKRLLFMLFFTDINTCVFCRRLENALGFVIVNLNLLIKSKSLNLLNAVCGNKNPERM